MKTSIIILSIVTLLFINMVFAQENISIFDIQNQKYESSMEKFYKTRSLTRTMVTQVQEDVLEADNYMVGPGDQFKINIIGELEQEFETEILPEGMLVVPSVGEIFVKKMSLKDCKAFIKEKIEQFFINSKISINLTGLRKFKVYLTGDVENAGTYIAQGSDRVSDILEISNISVKKQQDPEAQIDEFKGWADNTRIEIHHIDGKKSIVDITQFYKNGVKSENPFLNGGDVIFVPSINLSDAYVIIEGNVGLQGIHSLKTSETLFEFLKRVAALNNKSDLEHLVIYRNNEILRLDLLNKIDDYKEFQLQDKDKIIIPTLYDKVYVRGEVLTPGALPYLASYLAKDYVGTAGVLDSAVDMDDIVIIRQSDGTVLNGGEIVVEKGDTIMVPKRGREVFKDYMTIFAPIVSLAVSVTALIISANK